MEPMKKCVSCGREQTTSREKGPRSPLGFKPPSKDRPRAHSAELFYPMTTTEGALLGYSPPTLIHKENTLDLVCKSGLVTREKVWNCHSQRNIFQSPWREVILPSSRQLGPLEEERPEMEVIIVNIKGPHTQHRAHKERGPQ